MTPDQISVRGRRATIWSVESNCWTNWIEPDKFLSIESETIRYKNRGLSLSYSIHIFLRYSPPTS